MVATNHRDVGAPLLPQAAIILAGGTGRRLGGVSKPDFRINGTRLIDILLAELDALGFAGQIVVVGPPELDLPTHVSRVLEDPPLGGPLAGIVAGVAALEGTDPSALVLLATCDAPLAPRLVPALVSNIDDAEGAVPVTADDEGWAQYLHGVYHLGSLRRVPDARNHSIRRGFRSMDVRSVVDVEDFCQDVDTPDDATRMEKRH